MLNELKANIDHQILELTEKYSDESHYPSMVFKRQVLRTIVVKSLCVA